MSALALAAALVLGLSTPAATADQTPAATPVMPSQIVAFGDLDLASASGADALDARVRAAARRTCIAVGGRSVIGRSDCLAAFQAEAIARLPAPARQDYARARATRIEL